MKSVHNKKITDMLCVAYAYELQAYHGYLHAFTTVTGPLESVYGSIYKSFMEKELHHLEEIGKKIRVMGGMPPIKYPPITAVEEAIYKGYDETLKALQKGEEKALEIYTKIHAAADSFGDLPLVILIEEIISEEEEHHDRITSILMDAPGHIIENHDKLVVDSFEQRKNQLRILFG